MSSLSFPAVEFAGIQCQIHFGDYQEDKHKPGFIENLREYLPEEYSSVWGIEKKIFKEYKKHQRLSALEAKNLYTKTARALPTYGVTFFLVKEKQKDKMKLVARLLGINSESILRLDEVTKEVLQTWPLTHVKTYHAAKGEIFTLNFGDYSDKMYSVKSRDAYRIRDILEDYIDIIRRRTTQPYCRTHSDTAYITHDNVTASKANIVQHISNNPMKIVEQSFVGPSKMVPFEAGTEGRQGTHIITVQQVLVSEKGNHHQQAVSGGIPRREDMSLPFTRRLNKLNSYSVKLVSLLTDPTEAHIADSRKILEAMNEDMPFVRDGVKETIEKQTSEEEKRKLQDQMNDLNELINSLNHNLHPANVDARLAEDAAMRTADLTTQMYFALDARNQRRSRIITRSRKSFIEDEKCQRSLRRASYLVASSSALAALDQVQAALNAGCGEPGAHADADTREAHAHDILGKLNAAIAHYTMAYSADPKNVDYETAINSMHTINELMPEFAKDIQALTSTKAPQARNQILLDAKSLCDATKKICLSIEDREKLEGACKDYAAASGRLVFTFAKGRNYQKENEMLEVADDVGVKTSQLLMSAQALVGAGGAEPAASQVDSAGVSAADAANNLISTVQLTAPTIQEAHCQSAVTAAAEALSSSAQRLAAAWKPLLEQPPHRDNGNTMHHHLMQLAGALDKLKGAYSGLAGDEPDDVFDGEGAPQQRQRLKFITTMSANQKRWQEVDSLLEEPTSGPVKDIESEEAQRRLAQRLGLLNAAIASLLAATSDREHPDYMTAELALNTINELMPQLIQDSKMCSTSKDPETKAAMLEHIKALCDASKGICAGAGEDSPEDRSAAIAKFTNASGKLVFGITHRANPQKGNQILEVAEEAGQKTSQLVTEVQKLSAAVGGERGGQLESGGITCADAARALLTAAQVIAPSISEPRCQYALLSSVDKLSSSGQELANSWRPLQDDPSHKQRVQGLQQCLGELEGKLDVLRSACQAPAEDMQSLQQTPREQQKLQFIKTMSAARDRIQKAQEALHQPIPPRQSDENAEAVQQRLSGRLGELNAAIAALLSATADREAPDYKSAERAVITISELIPHVVQDARRISAHKEEASRAAVLDLLQELCVSSRALCHASAGAGPSAEQGLGDAVSKFCNASGKLIYAVNPRSNANRENQILALSAGTCSKVSQLLSGVEALAQAVGSPARRELDTKGATIADAAQGLLKTAQVTAPSISEPHCKQALLSSTDKLSSSAQELAHCWKPLLQDHKHQKQAAALQAPLEQLDEQLDALRKACHISDADVQASPRELQKLQFVKTMSEATEHFDKAQKALDKPVPPPLSSEKAEAVQQKLSGRLGELNAAIAALLSANADREKPDYKSAEQAIKTITELMPHVVQDTQSSSANKDEATRAAMLDLLRELCEASRALCSQADGASPQGLSDAVSKFSDASGKLVYVVSPRLNADREKRILGLSASACNATSQLLSGVEQLTAAVGGDKGQELDTRGAAVADAAQGLLHAAQVTASSISEPHCKQALLSSTDKLSSSAQEVAHCWKPLLQDHKHQKQAAALQAPLEQLDEQLDALRKACHISDADVQASPRELQKLQFVKTMSGATEHFDKAQKALDKPVPPPLSSEKAEAVEQKLSGRLGELNAAIAALLSANADREKPDYKSAEQAIKTITELMPHVVQDTQSSSANKDEATRAAMLDLLRELCEASRALCSQADGANPQGLSDAVSKFSDASGKLVYVVSPRLNADREKHIVGLSASACNATSQLLSGVEQLTAAVGGDKGQELDTRGAAVADAAQGLLHAAQVTAPSISEPHCKQALLSSADKLSSSAQELAHCWKPLLQDHKHQKQAAALQTPLEQLNEQLDALRKACHISDADVQASPRELQKLQFVKTMSEATEHFDKTQKALDKPVPPPLSSEKAEAVQQKLSGRLGELNAAIAALLSANADREKLDYKSAEQAIKTITELMPHVVQDTQSSSANKDEVTRAAMLDLLRELCEASRALCSQADGANPQGLSDAVSKFSDASGKLVYVVSPRLNADREKHIVGLSASACNATSQLLSGVEQLTAAVGGDKGQELDTRGAAVADAAQGLLHAAQVTAPSISEPHCKQALLSSADKLSSSAQELAHCWKPLLQDHKHQKQAAALQTPLEQLNEQLDALRKACHISDADVQASPRELQKLQFVKTMSEATEHFDKTQKALDKPVPPPLSSEKAEAVQQKLSGRLGELNAAIAALLSANADREKPDYKSAEQAIKTITELMPHVVQDTQSSSANKDEATRAAMLDLLRELCEASRALCSQADGANPQGLSDAVSKFSDASGKLVYVVSPRLNEDREKRILGLSASACNATSQLLSGVEQLTAAVGGDKGQELDTRGAAVADAAQGLLHAAQVTAPSISEPYCKQALLSSADKLSSSAQQLAHCWKPTLQEPKHHNRVETLQTQLGQLEAHLEALRKACQIPDGVPSARKPPPPTPKRSSLLVSPSKSGNSSQKNSSDATKDFLDTIRCEESRAHKTGSEPLTTASKAPSTVKTEEDKQMHQQFVQTVDNAVRSIKKAEEELILASKSRGFSPAISAGDCLTKQARLQRNIALAGVEVASLLSANYDDTVDYTAASKSLKTLPQLITTIVEDGKLLSSTVEEDARQAFLEEVLQVCQATGIVCSAAKNDAEQVKDAAIVFGDKSAKLLYVVSNDVDSTLEQEMISRAKAIADSVVQISREAGGVAGGVAGGEAGGEAGSAEILCSAGTRCQGAASKLLYTAKLVAPSIYETPCQEALYKCADKLSSELRTFADCWKPFSADPTHGTTIKHLNSEADNLERILEGLKSDVKGGRIGQRREIEKLVVEDTPLRQLTMKIMEDAQKVAEQSDLPAVLKTKYSEYSRRLSEAVRALELAAARCARTPHDTNKRRDLENAVQNLQMILLQSRPSRGDKERSNIIDLRDFIDEVSAEAEKLAELTSAFKVPTAGDKNTLQEIETKARNISKAAYELTHTDDSTGFDTSFNDILDVDRFGEECDDVIKHINKQLQSIEDAKARNLLYCNMLPLAESCNMLRFATKSGISAAKSAAIDSTLEDLDDIESRVIKTVVKDGDGAPVTLRTPSSPAAMDSAAVTALCRAVCAAGAGAGAGTGAGANTGAGAVPRGAVATYVAAAAAATDTNNPERRNLLLRHLYKLVHLLKTQTALISRRNITWQHIQHPEVAAITQQILQEIQNPESKFCSDSGKVKEILNDSDLTKLLIPGPADVVGDKIQQEDRLSELCAQVSSACGALALNTTSPPSLERSAHSLSAAALQLAAVARGAKNQQDPVQCERIEESAQELTFTTYGLLKTAELSCQDPNNLNLKRRLLDACRSLNESIDKLTSASSSASKLQQDCGSVSRALQLQVAALQQPPVPTSAMPYQECCIKLDEHQEIVYKLKSVQPMSGREFACSVHELGQAVHSTADISTHCAYLICVSETDSEIAKKGPVDATHIQRCTEALQDCCMKLIASHNLHQAKEESRDLERRVQDYSLAFDDAQLRVGEGGAKATLTRAKAGVTASVAHLQDALRATHDNMETVTCAAVGLLQEVTRAHSSLQRCPLVPVARTRCESLADTSQNMLMEAQALMKEVAEHGDEEVMTWVTFNTSRTRLLDAYDALIKSIRLNGQRAGILDEPVEDETHELETRRKTYLEVQVDLANKWLQRPMCKAEVKTMGQQAARNILDIATKMSEDLRGGERKEIRHVIAETEELLTQCSISYDVEKYSVLMDRIKELRKAVQRGVVTRVVEDLMEEQPLEELDIVIDTEEDEQKRKYLLERKIAELLAQVARVSRTARLVADAAGGQSAAGELLRCSDQTELLAPMLVQAAQERIASPDDQVAIEKYKALLAKYAESISKVRDLCDRSVDPMDFVQTAGDTMQRMRDESAAHNDALRGHQTSGAIIKLANRSIEVSMCCDAVRRDPEMRAALHVARQRVLAATPAADCRASRLPDWKESTAEILRTTGEVESALGGENIFKKQPVAHGANQQIYSVARDLHQCVSEWSSRDNEIVAVARRVAVLMARLSQYMETEEKQALIATSRSIVVESREVAELANKLAHECTDLRIKTNLLQTCERIPTISAQLKMLTTVKGSSLGHQGNEEDKEAMDMLVGNAQSLMLSIQDVVNAAASASVKIMSERGPRLRWVRKTHY